MAYTYGALKADVADFLCRRDLTATIPSFIRPVHRKVQDYVGPLSDLVNSTDTNSVLTNESDVYLWGALAEAGAYLKDPQLTAVYGAKFAQRLAEIALLYAQSVSVSPNGPTP